MGLRGILARAKEEYIYFTKRPWSLRSVGEFWDTVEDYDDINSQIYPYFRRFSNSKKLLDLSGFRYDGSKNVLDIQARSGQGTLYWSKILRNSKFFCVDFSNGLLEKAKNRLIGVKSVRYRIVDDEEFSFDEKFDLILCYETIEHVFYYKKFLASLRKSMHSETYIILTCPNILWEPVHWLSYIIGINHSEGPHRFLRKKALLDAFRENELKVVSYNSTILLPFNSKFSIRLDSWLEKNLPEYLRSFLMLRRSFILKCESQ